MTTHWSHTVKRVGKALMTNQIAHFAPSLYVRLTGETGRGLGEESSGQAADYFRACFDDYFEKLGIKISEIDSYLVGKRVLEYGPGDLPGVALLMIAHGAESVICVDRFPLVRLTKKNLLVIDDLLSTLNPIKRQRARTCFIDPERPELGFNPVRISYHIDRNGLSGLKEEIDLVISRAVLEHVNDLFATFQDMQSAMKKDAIAIHQVDLKSHGLHQTNPLDFLTWSESLWRLMYSHKGVPNRQRVDSFRRIVTETGFTVDLLEPTLLASPEDVQAIRPNLASPFWQISDQDLRWLGFWLVCRKKVT